MLREVLSTRLREYSPQNTLEQENVLQELMQHYILAGLSRAGLFEKSMFHGGTCLRIVFGMNRFSEDLDFLLKQPDTGFRWQTYLEAVRNDCEQEGIAFEVQDKSTPRTNVQKAFLKTDSIGKVLLLDLPFERSRPRKIRIKLEIDTNPPSGSAFTTHYITFPVTSSLTTQSLESGFSLKLHALLCRDYAKGRDWYDFLWYTGRRIAPDLNLLKNAIHQQGPWAGESVDVNARWVAEQMERTIRTMDWTASRNDVQRFLPLREQEGLRHWEAGLFLQHLARLKEIMGIDIETHEA